MFRPTPESQLRKLSEDGPISYGNNESDMNVKKKRKRYKRAGKRLIQKPIPSEDEEHDRDGASSWQREAGATCKVMSSLGVLTLLWLIQPPGNWHTAPHTYMLAPLGQKGFSTSLCNDKVGIPPPPFSNTFTHFYGEPRIKTERRR